MNMCARFVYHKSALGYEMNTSAYISIWLALPSSGIFLIKPLNIQKCSQLLAFLKGLKRKKSQPLSAGLRQLDLYALVFIV